MKRVIVTGAAGFIGYHTLRRLLADGCSVVGVDNLNDYYDIGLKRARLAELSRFSGFEFKQAEMANYEELRAVFAPASPEAVVHLAAQAGVRYSMVRPEAYIESNVTAFANLLECCRHFSVGHLLFASSSSVYGQSAASPFREQQPTDEPVSLYAATKKSGELIARSYSHLYGIPATGIRFFTVYGPWGRPDMAYFSFTERMRKGIPIAVYGNGLLKRDFTFVDDAVEAVVRLLAVPPAPEEGPPFRVINVGNRNPVLLLDFIAVLERLLGTKAILDLQPMQPGDVTETCADTTLLRQIVAFEPATPLETGLSAFVSWYRSFYPL